MKQLLTRTMFTLLALSAFSGGVKAGLYLVSWDKVNGKTSADNSNYAYYHEMAGGSLTIDTDNTADEFYFVIHGSDWSNNQYLHSGQNGRPLSIGGSIAADGSWYTTSLDNCSDKYFKLTNDKTNYSQIIITFSSGTLMAATTCGTNNERTAETACPAADGTSG